MLDVKGLTRVFEFINFQGLHQNVHALSGELERVDKLEATHSDGEILLYVLWDHSHLTKFTLQRFDNQVSIITLEVVYDYRQLPLMIFCTLDYTYYV